MWQLGWKNEIVMRKTQPWCTGVESNLRGRVLGEAKNSFIALAGKWDITHSGFMPAKLCVHILGGFGEEVDNTGSRAGLL